MHQKNRKSRLFFIEFLIVLFFFLIVSAVCLRLFAHARQITDRAEALSHAQAEAASAAELVSSLNNSDLSALLLQLKEYYPDESSVISSADTLTIFYDHEFQFCLPEDSRYTMVLSLSTGETGYLTGSKTRLPENNAGSNHKMIDPDTGKQVDIHITDQNQQELFTLSASFHTPLTREEALS